VSMTFQEALEWANPQRVAQFSAAASMLQPGFQPSASMWLQHYRKNPKAYEHGRRLFAQMIYHDPEMVRRFEIAERHADGKSHTLQEMADIFDVPIAVVEEESIEAGLSYREADGNLRQTEFGRRCRLV